MNTVGFYQISKIAVAPVVRAQTFAAACCLARRRTLAIDMLMLFT